MSLEESMKELAESNRELAAAQREYVATIREYGTRVLLGEGEEAAGKKTTGKAQTAAEKKAADAAAKKSAAAAAAQDDDGFGDEDDDAGSEKLSHDDVKALLVEVKNTNGDKEEALALIRKYGYDSIPKIQEKDFAKIAKDARAWLKKNG